LLEVLGSKVKLKWPNDLYLSDKKVCGAMTTIIKNQVVCGIGLNSSKAPSKHGKIDIEVKHMSLLNDYFDMLENCPSWSTIFSKYSVEFNSKREEFFGNYFGQGQSVELLADGSLSVDGEKVFGTRWVR
jgi:BirA family biotin operon repressor/biotin-[acetyl-CoA-carboxylase] ligase